MILCEGNMQDFESLKRGSTDDYLLKLEHYADKYEAIEKNLKKK